MIKCLYLIVFFLIIAGIGKSQDGISHYSDALDSAIYGKQNINIITVEKQALKMYQIDLAYGDTLTRTSTLAKKHHAIAAINGGFFNMREGYSVSYLESKDSVIAYTQNETVKRSSNTSMLNASFIIEKVGDIQIHYEYPDSVYFMSDKEYGVLGAGPLLILNGKKLNIRSTSFSSNRHPRTCICETEKSVLMITVDGRNIEAEGMSLYELQDYLLTLNCIDAINMDGGGSTTMWIKDRGIVNIPSDITGERPAANAIIILKK